MAKIWHFRDFFNFYQILDYYKIRTRTNFENPKGKSLDLHLIILFMLKELFSGSTDFTEAISKYPKYQNIFQQCLKEYFVNEYPEIFHIEEVNTELERITKA